MNLPKAFKPAERFSQSRRPARGDRCRFSPAIQLTLDLYASKAFSSNRPELYSGALCVIKANTPHLVIVRFDKASRDDLVSPEFLKPLKLTDFGQAVLASSKISAKMLKQIFGASEE